MLKLNQSLEVRVFVEEARLGMATKIPQNDAKQ